MSQILLSGVTISYRVEVRPRRRHPAIAVGAQREVTVLLPPGMDPRCAPALLQQKASWVLRQLERPRPTPHQFCSGEHFSLRGLPLVLEVVITPGTPATAKAEGDRLIVQVPHPQNVRSALVAWYQGQAREWLAARVLAFSQRVKSVPAALQVRDYRSRWGVCHQDGRVSYNWRIVQAPPFVIDYVVVHELTHLRHLHHQAAFWKALARILPDYDAARRWLREHGAELFW
ncbi:MAG: M48 family metallopeptidase [Firmicutes bacterium]|nr:M48 family metallopeptidase [Bacillota bacterium]